MSGAADGRSGGGGERVGGAGAEAAGGAAAWRGILAIIAKDLAIWIRSPVVLAVTVLPSLVLVLVLGLEGVAVSSDPVALVNLDPGGAAASALEHIALTYPGFRPRVLDPAAAERALNRLQVAAVLTIPTGFSQALQAGDHPVLTWQVRNFNDDSANDLRRALPDVVNAFLSSGAAGADPVHIGIRETDIHPQDVGLVAFQMIAVLAVLLLQAGLVNAGLAAVREWETGSVKELLLSPVPALGIVAGKVVAGVLAADIVGALAVAVATGAHLMPLPGPGNIGLALAAMTLLGLFASALGVALAAAIRVQDRLIPISINISFYLFFLGGGIVALAYLPGWLRGVARFIPVTYAVDALRGALLYGGAAHAGRDLLVLGAFAAAALALGLPALRRGMAH